MDRADDAVAANAAPPEELATSILKDAPNDNGTSSASLHPSNAGLLKELVDLALNFLSTASNESLIGAFAILTILTLIILGRIGLLLIGVALGVILHAAWEGPGHGIGDEGSQARKFYKRRELALEVSNRLLDWPARNALATARVDADSSPSKASDELSSADFDYASFHPATAAALRSLTDAVIRDYVK